MKICLSGPNKLSHLTIMDIAMSLFNNDNFVLTDMRYGPANGLHGEFTVPDTGEQYNFLCWRNKDSVSLDIQKKFEERPAKDKQKGWDAIKEWMKEQKGADTDGDSSVLL